MPKSNSKDIFELLLCQDQHFDPSKLGYMLDVPAEVQYTTKDDNEQQNPCYLQAQAYGLHSIFHSPNDVDPDEQLPQILQRGPRDCPQQKITACNAGTSRHPLHHEPSLWRTTR